MISLLSLDCRDLTITFFLDKGVFLYITVITPSNIDGNQCLHGDSDRRGGGGDFEQKVILFFFGTITS